MMRRDPETPVLRRLADRRWLRIGLLLVLAAVPVAVYAGAVPLLTQFVNGQIADADEVNANFAAVSTAVDDNDSRLGVLEGLPDQSCLPGQAVTGIATGGALICESLPPAPTVVAETIPAVWESAVMVICPPLTSVVAGGMRPTDGVGNCRLFDLVPGVVWRTVVSGATDEFLVCEPLIAQANATTDCECFAVCR
jgi:hypothetical protein